MHKLITLLALLTGCIGASQASAAPDALDRYVAMEMNKRQIPGLSIAILRNGRPIKLKGYGLANVELGAPANENTLYQSASLGKPITATAILMLVNDGKLSLDDSITRHIPNLPQSWEAITVRHLLTHTSGLSGYPEDFDFRRDWAEQDLVAFIAKQSLAFRPGEEWRYSNLGYVLLGAIIRAKTGNFYGDVLTKRIFQPAGMATARVISEADIIPNRAAGYRLDDGSLKNQRWVAPSLNTTADGALYLSIRDLARWDAALSRGDFISARLWDQAWTPVRLSSDDTRPYGFGWTLATERGQRIVEHSGRWQGFSSHLARFRDKKLTVILLANLADLPTAQIVREIAGLVDPDLAVPVKTYIKMPTTALDDYVGIYRIGSVMQIVVTRDGDRLWSRGAGQTALELLATESDHFFVQEIAASVIFGRDIKGDVTHFILDQGGKHRAERVR